MGSFMKNGKIQVVVYLVNDSLKILSPPRARAEYLSMLSREAVFESAKKAGLDPPSSFIKDHRGAPMPENGVWWGLSHKPEVVAGAASVFPVGLDVEIMRPVSPRLMQKIATEDEIRLLKNEGDLAFFKIWTAKEAVLKAAGDGMSGLGKCRLCSIESGEQALICFEGEEINITYSVSGAYIVAVVSRPEDVDFTYASR